MAPSAIEPKGIFFMLSNVSKKLLTAGLLGSAIALAGCVSSVRPYEVSQAEMGIITRIEAGTIVSLTPVNVTGLTPAKIGFAKRRNKGMAARAVTIVLRVERNNELISVIQGDDVNFQVGQNVWVQYGDRVRVIPR
jgi:hypothetical protein